MVSKDPGYVLVPRKKKLGNIGTSYNIKRLYVCNKVLHSVPDGTRVVPKSGTTKNSYCNGFAVIGTNGTRK